jgi:hypothetical protein
LRQRAEEEKTSKSIHPINRRLTAAWQKQG